MPIRIVDQGARPDAFRRNRDGIVVRQHAVRLPGRVSVMRRRDRIDHARNRAASVHDGAHDMVPRDNAVTKPRVAYVPRRADRQHGRRIGKRQSVLPGEIGAQHVGQVGTIGIERHARRVRGVEHRIGRGIRQAGMNVAATTFADPRNEALERLLIRLGPTRLGDPPMPRSRLTPRCRKDWLPGRTRPPARRRSCGRPLMRLGRLFLLLEDIERPVVLRNGFGGCRNHNQRKPDRTPSHCHAPQPTGHGPALVHQLGPGAAARPIARRLTALSK